MVGRAGRNNRWFGLLPVGRLVGSVHTDFGPEDQDKDANQDYAVVWLPRDEKIRERFRLALALGDGLTTSFRSEWASALVCSLALRALAEGDPALPPEELAKLAFNEAGQSLGRLGDEWARDPAASCPVGQFPSTWKYILRKGVLFQSTLTLAWLDRHCLHVAMVGDGGGVWRSYRPSPGGKRANDRVLAQCDLDRHQVSRSDRPTGTCVRSTAGVSRNWTALSSAHCILTAWDADWAIAR